MQEQESNSSTLLSEEEKTECTHDHSHCEHQNQHSHSQDSTRSVVLTRITNELKNLKLQEIEHKYDDGNKILVILHKIAFVKINLGGNFPFESPLISIELKDKQSIFSLFNFNKLKFEDIMKEHWHPSIKLVDIVEKMIDFIDRNSAPPKNIPCSFTRQIHKMQTESIINIKLMGFLLIIRLVLAIGRSLYETLVDPNNNLHHKQLQLAHQYSTAPIAIWYSDQNTNIQPPLFYYSYFALGTIIRTLFNIQPQESLENLSFFGLHLFLRILSIVLESIFIQLPIAAIINKFYVKNSKSFRDSLFVLISLMPPLLYIVLLESNIVTILYIGTLFLSLYFVMINQFELSTLFYVVSMNLNTSALWFLPIKVCYLSVKVIRTAWKDQNFQQSNIDIQGLNNLFNRFSTLLMCFLASMLIIWIPLLNIVNGIIYAETAFQKLFFSVDQQLSHRSLVAGNIWNVFGLEMREDIVQFTILFYCNVSTIFKIGTLNKRRLILSILTLNLMVLFLGKTKHNDIILQTIIAISAGLLYNQFQLLFNLTILNITFAQIDSFHSQGFLIMNCVFQILYQSYCLQFQNMISYMIQRSNDKNLRQTDEEENQKIKGIINQYFKVKNPSTKIFFKQNANMIGNLLSTLMPYLQYICYIAVFSLTILRMFITHHGEIDGIYNSAFNSILFMKCLSDYFEKKNTELEKEEEQEGSSGAFVGDGGTMGMQRKSKQS